MTATRSTAPRRGGCLLSGTRVATLFGPIRVDDLKIGDMLVVAFGAAQPVRWIGTRNYVGKLMPKTDIHGLMPIRIAAEALGAGIPERDLLLSPDHLVRIGGVFVPAERLLNAGTIARHEIPGAVRYFNIELASHNAIHAEGTAVASLLGDMSYYNSFGNVLEYMRLGYADRFVPLRSCLPVVTGGEALDYIRSAIEAQAERLGQATTTDADVHLQVDGVPVRATSGGGRALRFTVAPGAREVRIVSRCVAPADLEPRQTDFRPLGIRLCALTLRTGDGVRDVPIDDPRLVVGVYGVEGMGERWRWTNGNVRLPDDVVASMAAGGTLEVRWLGADLRYPLRPSGLSNPL